MVQQAYKPVGKSDHNAVLFVPTAPVVNVKCAATPMAYVYRSYDPNGKTLLVYDLKNFNWAEFYIYIYIYIYI